MTREEAAMKLSFHIMQCGLLMPIGWVDNNGEGSELFEAVRMAQDALREKAVSVHTNADSIRAMSDEELAKWWLSIGSVCECCNRLRECSDATAYDVCMDGVLKWFKRPAEVDA